jgi:small-conductance mechanosensitive channel
LKASFEWNNEILKALGLENNNLASIGLTLVEGLMILVVTYVVARLAGAFSRRATRNANWDVQLVLLVGRIFYVWVLAIGLLALLYVVAPQLLAPVLGIVGLLGLAFGLAFQILPAGRAALPDRGRHRRGRLRGNRGDGRAALHGPAYA